MARNRSTAHDRVAETMARLNPTASAPRTARSRAASVMDDLRDAVTQVEARLAGDPKRRGGGTRRSKRRTV